MGIVLNWVAQGVVVAATAGIGLWLLPAGRARARMAVWWTVIAVVMALPLVTLWSPGEAAPAIAGASPATASGPIAPLVAVPQSVWNATSAAAAAWIAWVCLQALRLSLDFRTLVRVRRGCQPVAASVTDRLRPSTRARLTKSRACLMVSDDVKAAAVLGFGPPIIAVQPALIAHLTDSELDQVLIHEWAHVARHDALGTLVQRLVHVLAGWHPAVWFATGRLHLEREMACDEVVVDATGSAKAYATCLTRVASLGQTSRGSRLAVAMLSSSALTRRVVRLLARRRAPAFAPYWMVTPAALALVAAFGTGQLAFVGVQLNILPVIEREVRAAELILAPRLTTAAIVAPARKPAASASPRLSRRLEREQVEPVSASIPIEASAAVADPAPDLISPSPEPAAAPPVASNVPATPDALASARAALEAAPAPAASDITTEAKDAWAAATQVGESIGRSSRKGAVSTAGFFTRISKRVATSF